jgi:hypothetical protein
MASDERAIGCGSCATARSFEWAVGGQPGRSRNGAAAATALVIDSTDPG